MPERLSVAACAALAVAVLGGAYALAHDGPAKPAPALASPAAIRLEDAPIGELHRVSPLPALVVPRPRPKPAQPQPQPVVAVPTPVTPAPAVTRAPAPAPVPAPAPAARPAPAPTAKQPAPAKPPVTFDDSG